MPTSPCSWNVIDTQLKGKNPSALHIVISTLLFIALRFEASLAQSLGGRVVYPVSTSTPRHNVPGVMFIM